jgi:hypothetical protein
VKYLNLMLGLLFIFGCATKTTPLQDPANVKLDLTDSEYDSRHYIHESLLKDMERKAKIAGFSVDSNLYIYASPGYRVNENILFITSGIESYLTLKKRNVTCGISLETLNLLQEGIISRKVLSSSELVTKALELAPKNKYTTQSLPVTVLDPTTQHTIFFDYPNMKHENEFEFAEEVVQAYLMKFNPNPTEIGELRSVMRNIGNCLR